MGLGAYESNRSKATPKAQTIKHGKRDINGRYWHFEKDV